MSKIKVSNVPFTGTPAQEQKLREALAELKEIPGGLMPALQKAQEIYGYLPIEVQKIVADVMDVSLEEVFGVVTFYAQFSLNPKGRYKIGVCLGTACFKQQLGIDAGQCTEDGKFSLDATRCIGCCGLAPVLTVNEDVYGKLTTDDVAGIIAKYH